MSNSSVALNRTEIVVSSAPSFNAIVRSLSLDLGEQAALTLMKKYPDAIFLTDDAAARLAAMTLGYRVHGSIGILIRAIRREQLTKEEVIDHLIQLPVRSTLHIRPQLLKKIIVKIK